MTNLGLPASLTASSSFSDFAETDDFEDFEDFEDFAEFDDFVDLADFDDADDFDESDEDDDEEEEEEDFEETDESEEVFMWGEINSIFRHAMINIYDRVITENVTRPDELRSLLGSSSGVSVISTSSCCSS